MERVDLTKVEGGVDGIVSLLAEKGFTRAPESDDAAGQDTTEKAETPQAAAAKEEI